MTVSNNHRVINFVIYIWGCRARFTMAGTKEFFGRLVRTYGAAFRHPLASQSESLAPCERRLGASRQSTSPLSIRFSVHTIQQKLFFSAERANYRFFCFAKITFQLSL